MILKYPAIELQVISTEDIPENIGEFFCRKSSFYNEIPESTLEKFDELLVVNHENGIRSFIASHEKEYSNREAGAEKLWYVADALPNDEMIGFGEIRLPLTYSEFVLFEKPFVGGIFTKPEHRKLRRGNLMQRLLVMREIAETKVDSPLYSDTLVSFDALKVIKRLVRKGLAEEYRQDDSVIYRSVRY
jgi:hypothetical protein